MKRVISNTAKKIIKLLDKYNQCTEKERLQMYYGLQNIIYNVVITSFILFLSYISDIFIETLLIFIFFGILRTITGGYHCNSIEKCMASTTLIMIGGGKLVHSIQINPTICIAICILVNIIFFSNRPKGTYKNPYTPEYSMKQHKRLKIISILLSIISVLSNSILRGAIIFSMVIVTILLIPTINHRFPTIE